MSMFATGGPNVFARRAGDVKFSAVAFGEAPPQVKTVQILKLIFIYVFKKLEMNRGRRKASSVQRCGFDYNGILKEIQVMRRIPRSENSAWASLQILRTLHYLR